MKRIIALVLSLVMALSLCAPAYAAVALDGEGTKEKPYLVDTVDELAAAIEKGGYITLADGEYRMPSNRTLKTTATISGSEKAVIDLTYGAYWDYGTLTFENVSFKTLFGYPGGAASGSDYAALYSYNVTYNNCTFSGSMLIGRDGATFNGCTFNDIGNEYIRTYGNATTFDKCTFNTDGKCILVYSDGNGVTAPVSVTNCVFNATKGAKAGAIANQNCAAIEIDNYGCGVNLTTSGNTIDSDFSGEWRIKTYNSGKESITANGVKYEQLAIDGYLMTIDSGKNVTVIKPAAEIGKVGYESLQAAVAAVKDGETITVNASGLSATVSAAKTFTVVGEAVTITVDETAFDLAVSEGKYTVTVKKAEIEEEDVIVDVQEPTVEVAEPEVDYEEGSAEAEIVESIITNQNAVKVEDDNDALKSAVADVTVDADKVAEAFAENNIPVVVDEVNVIVQPYFDVAIKAVEVEETNNAVTSASIVLDITPMYQVVATTAEDADDIDLEGEGQNAVVISDEKVEESIGSVVITVQIPKVVADLATGNKLYVTHEAKGGTYIYDATVKCEGEGESAVYSMTFVNDHGFSSFTVDAVDNTVAMVGDVKYADLQSAVNNVPSGGTIKVLKSGWTAEIVKAKSFKVEMDEGVTATITADENLVLSVVNGQYTASAKYTGGYYPYYPPTTTPDSELVKSPDTFDAGVALYVGVSIIGAIGTVALGKKRED